MTKREVTEILARNTILTKSRVITRLLLGKRKVGYPMLELEDAKTDGKFGQNRSIHSQDTAQNTILTSIKSNNSVI